MIRGLLNKYSHINWALADQAMVSGVNFLTGLLLARLLGVSEFGVFTLLWMGVLFVNSIQLAMIISPMMSIGPKQVEAEKDPYYSALIIQQAIFAAITFFILYLGIHVSALFKPEWSISHLAMPLATAGTAFQCQDFIRRYFFCQNKPANAFWNDVVSYLGQILALFFMFFVHNLDLAKVFWVIAITSALAVVFGLIKVKCYRISFDKFKKVFNRNWSLSKWLFVSATLQWGSGNLVYILTGVVLGAESVGIIKAVQNIMAFSHVLFQSMENFVPARSSQIYSELGFGELESYKNKVVLFGGGVTLLLAFLVSKFSGELLQLLYGDEYIKYKYILQWFSIVYIFMFLGFPYRAALRGIEDAKSIFIAQVIASIFVVLFGYIIIDNYKLIGVMVTFLLVYLIIFLSLHYSFSMKKKTIGLIGK